MSTAKHTLGPWKWDASWGWNRLIARDGTVICDDGSAGGEYSAVIDPSGEEHEKANARLIAAAPALLQALEEMVAFGKRQGWAHVAIINAEDAIRLAKGEE